MSAPCERAESPAPCACTNISLMQLFHELKQKFPGVPDHVVSNTIELYCHDKQACEKHLHSEVKASLTHAYHASSSAAARHLNQLKLNPPLKCRNQPIIKHSVDRPTLIKAVTCPGPQKGILSSAEDKENKLNTDANQNIVVEAKNEDIIRANDTSPVTIINLDSCHVKYNADSPSDIELSNENRKPEVLSNKNTVEPNQVPEQPESTNYRILKSNKIKSNLNERLERVKEKKTIKKEPEKEAEPQPAEPPEQPPNPPPQEKPKRPNTLDFIKPNPDFAFKPSQRAEGGSPAGRGARGYAPLNLSVNVNCHMDLSRGYEGWVAEYDSPRAITSVNLTVCTPSSGMASPERDEEGFEGHVTVTVSPTAPPRRRAPPPPAARLRPARPAPPTPAPPSNNDHTPSTQTQHVSDRSLIERQKERLGRLASALSQEKGRLVQLSKETQILAAAPPSPSAAQRLRDYVERLRDQCDTLAKRLEMAASEAEESNNFYSNIYTGQRPPSSWQCHMCTFRNHPLLDKCEECDMPRILVVRARDGITVRLMPGRRKITRSWVL